MSLGYAAAEADAASPASRLAIWRATRDQPAWARPVLLVIAAVSAFAYAWRASAPVNIEIYYAAAVRSMSMSWHDFLFGAFDPAGTITTDKLPGAFWVQAYRSACSACTPGPWCFRRSSAAR
jgi:4-amino-4-deoxy-L-arabinose transferase-like glycosyltransferase